MATPVYLNTGGGMVGAIRQRIFDDFDLSQLFGNRVRPGRHPAKLVYPYVVITHVSGKLDDLFRDTINLADMMPGHNTGDAYDVWEETILVQTWADSYEACRQIGLFLHARISRQTFEADCVPATLYPDSRILLFDSKEGEEGADIWHYDYRYHFYTADKILPDKNA